MNHESKCETWNYQTSRRKHQRICGGPLVWQWVLAAISKAWSMKDKIDKLDFIKTSLRRILLIEWKCKPQFGRKYLRRLYDKGLMSAIYQDHLKCNKEITSLKKGQNIWTDTSSEKINRCNEHMKRCLIS